jgi:antitoxin (DNA-binding transcriptional repressor) of toxin-antitoxin stability system
LNTVKVVPLLATDSLEGLLHARSNNAMTDLGLNLQALFASGNAVGVDASKLSQTLKAVAGRDLNSLLTIGRVSDNVVRVRLGASAQPSGEYVMVPRTYTIPVVLLVPISANHQANNGQSERTIRAVSKTVFVNALTGRLRRSRTNWQAILKAAPVHGAYEIAKFPDDKVFQLTEYARRGEYAEFAKAVSADSGDKTMDTDHIGKLWLEAISLRAADAIQTASFTLPAMPEPTAPPDQAGIITDNGKVTFVTLLGGQALHRMNMLASLDVSTGATGGAQPLRLYATDAALPSPDRDVVRFAFPSLAAAGLELAPGPVDAQQVSLRVQYHPMNGRIDAQAQQAAATDAGRKYPLLFLAQPAGSAGNDSGENPTGNGAAASTRPNLLSDGTAVVAVRLRQPSHGGIYLRASGCEIAGVDPTDCLEHVNGKWALRRAGSARLRLSNFVAPEVQLELNDEHGTVIQQVVCQIRR